MKFHSTTNDLKKTLEQSFSMVWAVSTKYLTKQYSKMVGRTPSWIFQSSPKQHSRKYNSTWRTLHKTNQQNFGFFMKFDEIINKIVIQNGGPDAILNISVIQQTIFIKIYPYMKNLVWHKLANFQLSVLRFDEIINKTVIQDGGRTPSWIFQSFQKLHSRKCNPTWMTLQETNHQNFSLL